MKASRYWFVAGVFVMAAMAVITGVVRATDSPQAMTKSKLQREQAQRRTAEVRRRNLDWRKTRVIDGGDNSSTSSVDNSVLRTPSSPRIGMYSSTATPPPPSPGLKISTTT